MLDKIQLENRNLEVVQDKDENGRCWFTDCYVRASIVVVDEVPKGIQSIVINSYGDAGDF